MKEIFGFSDDNLDYVRKNFRNGVTSPKRIFRDYFLSLPLKRLFISYMADQICVIDEQRTLSTKPDIIKALLKSYSILAIDVRSLYFKYKVVIESQINREELDFANIKEFEKFLRKLPFVLWQGNDTFRRCELTVAALDLIFCEIDFAKYNNSEISCKLLYQEYKVLFDKMGINSYIEVYYLLLNNKDKIKDVEIIFKNNFIIAFGSVDIDRQIRFILRVFKSLELNKFWHFYDQFYGVDIQALSLYNSEINKYRIGDKLYFEKEEILDRKEKSNSILVINSNEKLTNEEVEIFKMKLKEPIYSVESIEWLFKVVAGRPREYKLSLADLEVIGYKLMDGWVFKSEFNLIDEAIYAYLEQLNTLNLENDDKFLLKYDKFPDILMMYCSNFKFIEVEPEVYVSLRKLEKHGITKHDIFDYIDSMESFSNRCCFTIAFIRQLGFSAKIDSLGFTNYFCESILKNSKRFMHTQIGNTTLFCSRGEPITLFNLIEEIVIALEGVKVVDLIRLIQRGYDIDITEAQLIETIKRKLKSEMFYSKQKEKIYRDYDTYQEDI